MAASVLDPIPLLESSFVGKAVGFPDAAGVDIEGDWLVVRGGAVMVDGWTPVDDATLNAPLGNSEISASLYATEIG